MTEFLLPQPPIMSSYIGSDSILLVVKATWQFEGPLNSKSSSPDTIGRNAYVRLSSVVICSLWPKHWILKKVYPKFLSHNGFNLNFQQRNDKTVTVIITFDYPCSCGTPSGANTDMLNGEGFGINPSDERFAFAFFSSADLTAVPAEPKATELVAIQNIGSFYFDFVWLLAIVSDYTFWVAPTTNEYLKRLINCINFLSVLDRKLLQSITTQSINYLNHRIRFSWSSRQCNMSIIWSFDFEIHNAAGNWIKSVLKIVFGEQIWNSLKLWCYDFVKA